VIAAIKHKKHKKRKRRTLVQPRIRLHVKLLSAQPETASAGTTITVTNSTDIVSTTAFDADCNGQKVPALPALSGQLFGLDPETLNCAQVTITPTTTTTTTSTSAPVQLAVLSDADNVMASVVGHGSPLTITVSATGPIATAGLASHGRAVHVRATGLGSGRVTLKLERTKASNTTVSATVSGLQYVGQIPRLPGPYYVTR
jgi:hypothetical protein